MNYHANPWNRAEQPTSLADGDWLGTREAAAGWAWRLAPSIG